MAWEFYDEFGDRSVDSSRCFSKRNFMDTIELPF